MHGNVVRLMEWRAGLLQAGRVEDLARQHICPLPLYVEGDMRPVGSSRQLEDIFRGIHGGLRAAGSERLTIEVRAVELPRKGRFRVWCDWVVHRTGQAPRRVAATVDYLRQTEAGLMTEMLECSCARGAVGMRSAV
jgi:hypothetical protein